MLALAKSYPYILSPYRFLHSSLAVCLFLSYEEICQAQGGFSCPPKGKQNHGKHEEDLKLCNSSFSAMKKSVKQKEAFLATQKYKQNYGKHEEDLMLLTSFSG